MSISSFVGRAADAARAAAEAAARAAAQAAAKAAKQAAATATQQAARRLPSAASSFQQAARAPMVLSPASKLSSGLDVRSGLAGPSIRASALLNRLGRFDIRGDSRALGIGSANSGGSTVLTIRNIRFNDKVPGDSSFAPALGPAMGGPPDYLIDLNQVSPSMLGRLSPEQTQHLMDLIDRANPSRIGFDDHGDTSGRLAPDPVTYLPAGQMFGMLMAEKMEGSPSVPALANLLAARPGLGNDGTLTSLLQQPGITEQVYQQLMSANPMTDERLTTVTNVLDHIAGGWNNERLEEVYSQLMSLGPVNESRLQRIGEFLSHVGGWNSERIGELTRAAIQSGDTLTMPEADYLGTVIGRQLHAISSDPQRMQTEMNAMMGAMIDGLPSTPENVGMVTGLVMAGALKEVASLRDDAQATQQFLTNLTYSLAGLGNLAPPPWNAVVAISAPWVAQGLSSSVSVPNAVDINRWVGAIEGDWIQHPEKYNWSREDAVAAFALVGVMLNENGFGYSRNP